MGGGGIIGAILSIAAPMIGSIMGGGGEAPSMPTPQPQPAPVTDNSAQIKDAEQAQKKLIAQQQGLNSTVLTRTAPVLGDQGTKNTLLGA